MKPELEKKLILPPKGARVLCAVSGGADSMCLLALLRETADFEPADCRPEDPALITFTTGSTGVPKAALRTCGFLWAQHVALAASLDVQPGDVDLATLPIFALNNITAALEFMQDEHIRLISKLSFLVLSLLIPMLYGEWLYYARKRG